MKRCIIFLFVACSLGTVAQTKSTNTPAKKKVAANQNKKIDEYEMKKYFMVFLKSGPKRDQDSATSAEIQKGHLAHLDKMANEGKLDLAGPFLDNGDIRGICVYNVATKEEVEKLVNMDPAIIAGRLVAEIHPWYSAKGASLK